MNWQASAMRERIAGNAHFNIQSSVVMKARLVVETARQNSYMLLQAKAAAEAISKEADLERAAALALYQKHLKASASQQTLSMNLLAKQTSSEADMKA